MADTSITRRLSFGSRTFPIDKYLSGIDDAEMLGLNYIEKQHGVPYSSHNDLEAQQELFSSLKYNYMQNNIMLKMLENIDASIDMSESEDKLKRAKQIAKEQKKEQQKVDQEIRQAIAQIVHLQQQYQDLQINLKNNLAPLNKSCELPDDKDTKGNKSTHATIETQTEAEYESSDEEDDYEGADLARGAERIAFQRALTQQIAGQPKVELSKEQATLHLGPKGDTLSFELVENGRPELAGAFCNAAFQHGDILDFAAKINDYSLLCYDLSARLACRDAIAADVAQIAGSTWDGAWQVSVSLPKGHTANLRVDPNYGTEYGRVKVARWSALDDELTGQEGAVSANLKKTLEDINGPVPFTLPQVVSMLSTATANV